MTAEEFKILKPEYKDAEGDELWDAMHSYFIQQKRATDVVNKTKPIWKTHTLRWLFYRRKDNVVFGKNGVSSDKMCQSCKKGVNSYLAFSCIDSEGKHYTVANCPFCKEKLVRVPNTTISHKLYKFWTKCVILFWVFLDKIRLVRSSIEGRYGMFGDESRYTTGFYLNMETGKSTSLMRKRKWWEYIIIEKPRHKF